VITNVVVFFMSDEQPIVFVVDDDQSIRDALQSLLHTVGLEVRVFRVVWCSMSGFRA
jgi:FixJ family two-component response regulator